MVVLEFGVRVTEGGDTTGVTDGGGDGGGDVTGFDPQAAAVTSMTAGTTSASLKQDSDNLGRVTIRRWSTGRARVPVHR